MEVRASEMIKLSFIGLAVALLLILGLAALCLRLARKNRQLAIDAETFRTVAEEAGDGLLLQEEDSSIVWANRAYCQLFGYSMDELVGQLPLHFALPEDIRLSPQEARLFRFDDHPERFDFLSSYRNVKRNGEEFINQLRLTEVARSSHDQPRRFVTVSRDVTTEVAVADALAEANQRIRQQAATDALTGLSNRRAMTAYLEKLIAAGPFALIAIDLDDFKGINDSFGHAAGDTLLVHAGRTIKEFLKTDWYGARMGGDEFTLAIPGSLDWPTATRYAIALKRRFATPIQWQETELVCGASLGVALSDGANSVDELMHHADVALYAAKARRNTRVALYDTRMNEQESQLSQLRSGLAEAVQSRSLEFYAQPTIDLLNNSVRGFELLVRWTDPKLGPVSADKIVRILGELSLLRQLDKLAALAAFEMCCLLRDAGRSDLLVGFNISPGTLKTPEFVDTLIWQADALDVPSDRIIVELLETTVLSTSDRTDGTAAQVARLKEAGFRPLLDDFGIGYAGLSHLAELGVEGLKIDRSLVSKINVDPVSRRIVEAVISLCADLGFRVVAEGVETPDQLEVLRDLGCETWQGYLFSKPLPLMEAIKLVERKGTELLKPRRTNQH